MSSEFEHLELGVLTSRLHYLSDLRLKIFIPDDLGKVAKLITFWNITVCVFYSW